MGYTAFHLQVNGSIAAQVGSDQKLLASSGCSLTSVRWFWCCSYQAGVPTVGTALTMGTNWHPRWQPQPPTGTAWAQQQQQPSSWWSCPTRPGPSQAAVELLGLLTPCSLGRDHAGDLCPASALAWAEPAWCLNQADLGKQMDRAGEMSLGDTSDR